MEERYKKFLIHTEAQTRAEEARKLREHEIEAEKRLALLKRLGVEALLKDVLIDVWKEGIFEEIQHNGLTDGFKITQTVPALEIRLLELNSSRTIAHIGSGKGDIGYGIKDLDYITNESYTYKMLGSVKKTNILPELSVKFSNGISHIRVRDLLIYQEFLSYAERNLRDQGDPLTDYLPRINEEVYIYGGIRTGPNQCFYRDLVLDSGLRDAPGELERAIVGYAIQRTERKSLPGDIRQIEQAIIDKMLPLPFQERGWASRQDLIKYRGE